MLVQAYPSAAQVKAGNQATFVVWVWSTAAGTSNVSVKASVAAASYLGAPSFPTTFCASASGATCTISSLPVGQIYELLAAVPVKSSATPSDQVKLTVAASASGALSFSSSAAEVVVSQSTTIPGANPQIPTILPMSPTGAGVTPVDPSSLFPAVTPSAGSSIGLPAAAPRTTIHASTVSATVPLDARLIGGQVAGLAVLAGAVLIAVARLSLRVPKPTALGPAAPVSPVGGPAPGSPITAPPGPPVTSPAQAAVVSPAPAPTVVSPAPSAKPKAARRRKLPLWPGRK